MLSERELTEIERFIRAHAREPNAGLIIPPSALASTYRDKIIAIATATRLPSISSYSEFAVAGGLISYGFDRTISYELAASYVDRILKGEKPSDLPVQAPTKFELVVNMKTAKALGLSISEVFLTVANEVIE